MPFTESEIRERTRVEQHIIQNDIDDSNAAFRDRLLEDKGWIDAHKADAILKIMKLLEKIQKGNLKLIYRLEGRVSKNNDEIHSKMSTLMTQLTKAILKKHTDLEQELHKQQDITRSLDKSRDEQLKFNDKVWDILTDLRQKSGQYVPRSQKTTPSMKSRSSSKSKSKSGSKGELKRKKTRKRK